MIAVFDLPHFAFYSQFPINLSTIFEKFDLIFAMDKANYHYKTLKGRTSEHEPKDKLILQDTKPSGKKIEVLDQYIGGTWGFEMVFEMLGEACEKIDRDLSLKLCNPRNQTPSLAQKKLILPEKSLQVRHTTHPC